MVGISPMTRLKYLLVSSGVINLHNRDGWAEGSTFWENFSSDWVEPKRPTGPIAMIRWVLRSRREALGDHWLFGGSETPEGHVQVPRPGGSGCEVRLQVLNRESERALRTLTRAPDLVAVTCLTVGSA